MTPKAVHAAEPFITDTATALLADVPVPGTADLVTAFTVPLPNRVTVHLLGFPPEDAQQIAAWAKELMESGFPLTNQGPQGEGFAAGFPTCGLHRRPDRATPRHATGRHRDPHRGTRGRR